MDMFPHEKLHVYGKTLAFVASASTFSAEWDKRHAVVDQFHRAAESLVLNLAEGARLRSIPNKLRTLDYALGSCLECAACLDIARIKSFLNPADSNQEKAQLCEIARMLVGLRKTWETWKLQEEPPAYRAALANSQSGFHHEKLEVYGTALKLVEWLVAIPGGKDLSCRHCRQIDEGITSVVLNIAEGNGRYSELDHRRFLDVAEGAAVKVAAHLDLGLHKGAIRKAECQSGKELLQRIMAMLARM